MSDAIIRIDGGTSIPVSVVGGAAGGEKGDPGGNAMAIGLFGSASGFSIPTGTDLVKVSGTSAIGDAGAGREFAADVAVNAAYVATYPATSFISSNGRGFREVRIRDVVSFKDSGATGNNDAADAAKIATLFGQVAPGGEVSASPGYFKITGAGYSIKRQFDLKLAQGAVIRSDQTTGQRFNALNVNITLVDGDASPTTAGEARGLVISGGKYYTNNLSTPGSDAAGGYGIALSADATADYKALKQFVIRDANLYGGFGGFLFKGGNVTKELQWGGLYNCTTSGGTFAGTDGEIAVDCLCYDKPYTFDLIEGSFCCGVFRGTVATGAGAIDVINGSKLKIHDVQMEHNTGVTSTMNLGAQVIMRGNVYPGVGNELIGNNLGAGSFVTNTVALFNMKGTVIDRNYFGVAVTSDLYLDRHATDPTKDAYDTIVGYYNRYRGTRARKGYGFVTDVSRLMAVNYPAAGLRTAHRGLWYPVFALLTATATNLTDGLMEMMIEHSGAMKLQGKIGRSSGGFTAGLAIANFPLWVMPSRSINIPVIVDIPNSAAVGVAYLDFATGALTMVTDHPTATAITIQNHAWNAVTDPTYYSAPL